jgi:hypothetical protein
MEEPALCPASFTRRGLYRNGRQITKKEFASSLCISKLWRLTISCKGHADGGFIDRVTAVTLPLSAAQTVSICC